MDENVLAAALRLNEPITFGRVEPLHDTGRHRTLSPFWNFDDTRALHRIQDVARHARPYCFLAITKKFDQSELDHRPPLASYSPAWIRAAAAMQRFGRYQRKNGPVLDIVNVSSLTHFGHPLYYRVQALLSVNSHSAVTISARVGNPASLPRCWTLYAEAARANRKCSSQLFAASAR